MPAEFHLLGGAALLRADGQLVAGAAAQPRRLAVLAVLADAWPAPVTRDRLVGLIWPDQDENGARRLLTQALYALKRELGEFTRGSGRDIALDPDAIQVDLVEFRRAIADGDPHRAAARYRGPVLDGLHVRGAVEFERWVETVREGTRRQFQSAVEEIASGCAAAGEWRDAARWRERLVRESPYDAQAVLALVDAWLAAGDRGAVLAAATSYERRMREELEVEPDPVVRLRAREALGRAAGDAPARTGEAMSGAGDTRAEEARFSATDTPPVDHDAATGGLGAAFVDPPAGAAAPPGVASGHRRMRRAAVFALPLAIAGILVATMLARDTPGASNVRTITVLPFEVVGDSGDAALGALVTDVVRSSLGGRYRGGTAVTGSPDPWGTVRGKAAAAGALVRLEAELVPGRGSGGDVARATVTGPRDSVLALAGRLSRQLMPSAYPRGVRERVGPFDPEHFGAASTLRRFLDAEGSLRQGDFESAHAGFVAVTERDPDAALAWYRRAIAAEMAHRNDDVAPSIDAALARDSALGEVHRLRVRAYAAWRSGDASAAEQMYLQLLRANPADRDAWFQLAELQYHSGPLHGRPLDRSLDSWDRVVALDSGDVPALIHAARLHARAGDLPGVEALLRRATDAGATGASVTETRVVAALARGDGEGSAAAGRILDTVPEYSLHFLQGVVAGQLEQPAAAVAIARRMTEPGRPESIVAQGHLALAYLALAQGRWREAMAALDSAAVHNPVAAGWTRAYFVSLPFVRPSLPAMERVAGELRALPSLGQAAPLYLQIGVAGPAAGVIQPYLESLVRMRRDTPGARASALGGASRLDCTSLAHDPMLRHLCADLEAGLVAEAARRAGREGEALNALEGMDLAVPYQYAGRSQFFARSRERYLRAALLEAAGRGAEAEEWYAAVPHGAWTDYVFLAPAYLARARLVEARGDRAGAAAAYGKVLSLWARPDPELEHVVREARAGLARTRAR